MDVREKLVEILKQAPFEGKLLDEWWWEEKIKIIADHLISNGVTVQEWISVTERLPDEHESLFARYKGTDKWHNAMFTTISYPVIVCAEYENGKRIVKTDNTVDGVWRVKDSFHPYRVTHWMQLPQPPKGE